MISRQTTEMDTPAAAPDLLGEFLAERTVAHPEHRVGGRTLFAAWRSWCIAVDEAPGTAAAFATAMVRHGIATTTRGSSIAYLDLALTRTGTGDTR